MDVNIEKQLVFGTEVTIIGTKHVLSSDYKEQMKSELGRRAPDLVCIEFPENGSPHENLGDIEYADIAGAVEYCKETGTEYRCVDKFIEGTVRKIKENIAEEERAKMRESDSGSEVRKILFSSTKVERDLHKREQTMFSNVLRACSERQYQRICMVVGKSHVHGVSGGLETFNV